MKTCSYCQFTKEIWEFNKGRNECRKCWSAINKAYYEKRARPTKANPIIKEPEILVESYSIFERYKNDIVDLILEKRNNNLICTYSYFGNENLVTLN